MSEQNSTLQPGPSSLPDNPGRQWSRRARLAGSATGVLLAAALVVLGVWMISWRKAATSSQPASGSQPAAGAQSAGKWERPLKSQAELADQLGVRIVYVAVTGGGGLIDLRYQVVNPDKANALHNPEPAPALVDQASGLVVNQLLMGHSHTGAFHAGETYYLIFENPGNLVQRGSKVSVLLASSQVDNVIVK